MGLFRERRARSVNFEMNAKSPKRQGSQREEKLPALPSFLGVLASWRSFRE
jgi:hypothetical protein